MYKVGDKIAYPMHGAGTIARIESKEILGAVKDYYILNISCGSMDLMIPVDNCDSIGVRPVVSKEEIQRVMEILGQDSFVVQKNWNKRVRENMDRLKTGNLAKVAEIVRDLTRMDRSRKLSAGEKKMLSNARRILISEVMLVEGLEEKDAFTKIEAAI